MHYYYGGILLSMWCGVLPNLLISAGAYVQVLPVMLCAHTTMTATFYWSVVQWKG